MTDEELARVVEVLADRQYQRDRRDHLIVGIRMLIADHLPDGTLVDAGAIRLVLQRLLGTHTDRIHESSCPEHTGYKVCYCDCPACRPDGVCACTHCREWHRGHTNTATGAAMTTGKHLAEVWRGGDGARIACSCKQWRAEPGDGLGNQRAAHRQHRVDMGETVQPLAPTKAERLAAAEAAIARVREIATEMAYRRAAPAITAYGAALLAVLDGDTPKDHT